MAKKKRKKAKKKTWVRGPKPGHGGRKPRFPNAVSRTVRLGKDHWERVAVLFPDKTWTDRILAMIDLSEQRRAIADAVGSTGS